MGEHTRTLEIQAEKDHKQYLDSSVSNVLQGEFRTGFNSQDGHIPFDKSTPEVQALVIKKLEETLQRFKDTQGKTEKK